MWATRQAKPRRGRYPVISGCGAGEGVVSGGERMSGSAGGIERVQAGSPIPQYIVGRVRRIDGYGSGSLLTDSGRTDCDDHPTYISRY